MDELSKFASLKVAQRLQSEPLTAIARRSFYLGRAKNKRYGE
jgi:hypothetical protein